METGAFEKKKITQTSAFQDSVKRLVAGRLRHKDYFDLLNWDDEVVIERKTTKLPLYGVE